MAKKISLMVTRTRSVSCYVRAAHVGHLIQVILHDALGRRRKIASNLSHPGRKVAKQSLQRQFADVDPHD